MDVYLQIVTVSIPFADFIGDSQPELFRMFLVTAHTIPLRQIGPVSVLPRRFMNYRQSDHAVFPAILHGYMILIRLYVNHRHPCAHFFRFHWALSYLAQFLHHRLAAYRSLTGQGTAFLIGMLCRQSAQLGAKSSFHPFI